MSKDKPPAEPGRESSWKRLLSTLSGAPRDRQALIDIVRESETRNILDPDALTMIEGAIQVAELQVSDIMVPRVQMVIIEHDADPNDIIKTVLDSGHSRFPVVSDDQDDVVGILLAKDLLAYCSNPKKEEFRIKDMMRQAVFIPESKRLNILLREFKANRNHMAIVIDEYGIAGLVTIEDVIEEIVGEIADEHDYMDEETNIELHTRGRYIVRAITPINEFNEYFETELSDEDYDTVGGLITSSFGRVPKRGEEIDFEGFNVKVLRADKRRLHLLRFGRSRSKPEE
ncbi:MAG: HlyC/CorC family transporter [Gammaproteobacteria bacterium]